MNSLIEWLEEHMMSCVYKRYLDIECPGCGMQRSFIELLKGNITESFITYPPLLPLLIMFLYLGLHLVFKFNNGAKYLKYIFITNTAIILTNYFYKLFIVGV